MVTAFFERLGNAGVLLIAGALLVGGLAGGAVVHHYERTSADTAISQHQGDNNKNEQKQAKNKGQGKQKHAQKDHQQGDPAETETD